MGGSGEQRPSYVRFEVLGVKLSNHVVEHIEQSALAIYACPICQCEDKLQSLAVVIAQGVSSLESCFCTRCHHRFHRKFPRAEWLRDYYQRKFQSDNRVLPKTSYESSVPLGNRARALAGRVWRALRGLETPNRLYEFCDGVLREGGGYYAVDRSIRKILEVGCGYGDNLSFLHARGYETYGTESSPVRVASCLARGLNVFLIGIDEFETVRRYAPFDFIYSSHVLEHVIDADSHLGEVAALLREDGYIYLETPHLSGETLIYQSHTVYHVHTFSLRSLQTLLQRYGLSPIRMLVDNNLRVLAQKRERPLIEDTLLGGSPQPLSPDSFPYISVLAHHSPGDFHVRWDHYRVDIARPDGRVLFADRIGAVHVLPGPNLHEIALRSRASVRRGEEFPVVFDYVSETHPPVWYKL